MILYYIPIFLFNVSCFMLFMRLLIYSSGQYISPLQPVSARAPLLIIYNAILPSQPASKIPDLETAAHPQQIPMGDPQQHQTSLALRHPRAQSKSPKIIILTLNPQPTKNPVARRQRLVRSSACPSIYRPGGT